MDQAQVKRQRLPLLERVEAVYDPFLLSELTMQMTAFTTNCLTQMVREYVDATDIGKRGSCHLFRHAMATLMLENGADVRFIQAMLGHAKLETTQIYTQFSIRKLKEIHEATHPAKLHREGEDSAESSRPEASTSDQPADETPSTDSESP